MQNQTPYYVQKLKEDFSQKQRRFPQYSLRAYARDMGLHAATLSMMFKGTRGLPFKKSLQVAEKLALGPKERTLFLESLHQGKANLDNIKIQDSEERFMLDESYFNVLSEWEHLAVLTLFECDDFIPDPLFISARLKLSMTRTEVVINNLINCGLLINTPVGLERAHPKVRSTEDVTSSALRKGHLETLDMGKEKLQEIDVNLRDFSSIMVAIDPEKVSEAKIIIREFRQKMAALVKEGNRTEVYQMAIQFYPLTDAEISRSPQ